MDIEKLKLNIRKHSPEILTGMGIAGMIIPACLAVRNKSKKCSNNWLKMHGYPMRRKIKRRFKRL